MKKVLGSLILVTCLLIISGCGYSKTADYRANLEDVLNKMLDNAGDTEPILEQYSNVWGLSIESRGAIEVNSMAGLTGLEPDIVKEYFSLNGAGNINNDFSTNVSSMKSYYESTGDLEEIEKKSSEIKNVVTELNNPPKEYKEVYDEVLDLYDLVEKYTGMAIEPNGSLTTFNESKNQLSSDIVSKYKRIEVLMPSEK